MRLQKVKKDRRGCLVQSSQCQRRAPEELNSPAQPLDGRGRIRTQDPEASSAPSTSQCGQLTAAVTVVAATVCIKKTPPRTFSHGWSS